MNDFILFFIVLLFTLPTRYINIRRIPVIESPPYRH